RGRPYVAAYSAGSLFAGSARSDSVWLFGLDGEIDAAEPPGSLTSFAPDSGSGADPGRGRTVYETARTFCHGPEGEGGHGGGPAFSRGLTLGRIVQVVTEGRNDMPAFGAAISDDEIRDVAAYVLEMVEAKE